MVLTNDHARTPTVESTERHRTQPRTFVEALDDQLSPFVVGGLVIAWVVFFGISYSVQPPMPDPPPAPDALSLSISLVLMVTMLAAITGLGLRRRWGALASIAGGGVLMLGATTCYLTGHTGSWIAIQFAAGLGLAAVAAAAFRGTANR